MRSEKAVGGKIDFTIQLKENTIQSYAPLQPHLYKQLFFAFSRNDYKKVVCSSGQNVFVRNTQALENQHNGTTTDYN